MRSSLHGFYLFISYFVDLNLTCAVDVILNLSITTKYTHCFIYLSRFFKEASQVLPKRALDKHKKKIREAFGVRAMERQRPPAILSFLKSKISHGGVCCEEKKRRTGVPIVTVIVNDRPIHTRYVYLILRVQEGAFKRERRLFSYL